MNLHHMDHSNSEDMMHKSNHQRGGFLLYAFQMNLEDTQMYDMVVNTEKVDKDSVDIFSEDHRRRR